MLLVAPDSPSALRIGEVTAGAAGAAAEAPVGVSVWRVTMDIMRAFLTSVLGGEVIVTMTRHEETNPTITLASGSRDHGAPG